MKIKHLFLIEYNLQNLVTLFQEKYVEQKRKDQSNLNRTLQDFIKSIENPLRKENKFQFIEPYMKWIVQKYVNGKLDRYEDVMSKVVPGLLKYDSLKRKNKLKPEHKDINSIKDIDNLLDILDQYREEDTKSGKEKEKEIEENFYRTGEARLLYNDSNYKIVVPKTERASCFFGRNTRWCTAAKSNNMFKEYNKKGNLYIIILKKENKRFQFHFGENQFMDETDRPINFEEFYNTYPDIYKFFSKISKSKKSAYFRDPKEINKEDLLKSKNADYILFIIKNNLKLLQDHDLVEKIVFEHPILIFFVLEHVNLDNSFLENFFIKNQNIVNEIFESNNKKLKNLPIFQKESFYIKFSYNHVGVYIICQHHDIRKILTKKFLVSLKNLSHLNYEYFIKRYINFFIKDFDSGLSKNDILKEKNIILAILDELNKNKDLTSGPNKVNDIYLVDFFVKLRKLKDNSINEKIKNFFSKKKTFFKNLPEYIISSKIFLNSFEDFLENIGIEWITIFNKNIDLNDFIEIYRNKGNLAFDVLEFFYQRGKIKEELIHSILNHLFIDDLLRKKNNLLKIMESYDFLKKMFFSDSFFQRIEKTIINNHEMMEDEYLIYIIENLKEFNKSKYLSMKNDLKFSQ